MTVSPEPDGTGDHPGKETLDILAEEIAVACGLSTPEDKAKRNEAHFYRDKNNDNYTFELYHPEERRSKVIFKSSNFRDAKKLAEGMIMGCQNNYLNTVEGKCIRLGGTPIVSPRGRRGKKICSFMRKEERPTNPYDPLFETDDWSMWKKKIFKVDYSSDEGAFMPTRFFAHVSLHDFPQFYDVIEIDKQTFIEWRKANEYDYGYYNNKTGERPLKKNLVKKKSIVHESTEDTWYNTYYRNDSNWLRLKIPSRLEEALDNIKFVLRYVPDMKDELEPVAGMVECSSGLRSREINQEAITRLKSIIDEHGGNLGNIKVQLRRAIKLLEDELNDKTFSKITVHVGTVRYDKNIEDPVIVKSAGIIGGAKRELEEIREFYGTNTIAGLIEKIEEPGLNDNEREILNLALERTKVARKAIDDAEMEMVDKKNYWFLSNDGSMWWK